MIKIKFISDNRRCSFTLGNIYEAYPTTDGYGGYAIYDDSDDSYRYSEKFVEEHFIVIEDVVV